MPAQADLGSCEFRLFSTWMKASYLVCQTVDNEQQCGTWNDSGPRDTRYTAYAQGKSGGHVEFNTTGCDARRAIGMCQLKRGRLYFYDGNPKEIASGCTRMLGEFFDQAPELRAIEKR